MRKTLLQAVVDHIFGNKYYANIVYMKGSTKREICSHIFLTKEEAEKHEEVLRETMSYQFVERISFRSRHDYSPIMIHN